MTRSTWIRSVLVFAIGALLTASAAEAAGPYQFYSTTPCRIVDTRGTTGPTGGPVLAAFQRRNFPIKGNCGVPLDAKAAVLNVTIAAPTDGGYLTLWPNDPVVFQPTVSTINWAPTEPALANGAIVPLHSVNPDLSVYHGGAGQVHLILDVTGFFK